MAKLSKRYRQALALVEKNRAYSIEDAIDLLKRMPHPKFDETVEIAFHLGVDPRKSDQMVRGMVVLPHGTGKKVRVLVFTKEGPQADAAREAGADFVGFEDLIEKVKGGWTDFDVAIATPEAMTEVRKLGKILGPRGLMPNPKVGTVTNEVGPAVKEAKAGRVEFRVDRTGNVHMPVGKVSFPKEHLVENIRAAIEAIQRAKPQNLRGAYILGCSLAATMSPGLRIDPREYR